MTMRRFFRQVMALSGLAALAACGQTQNPLAPVDAGEADAGASAAGEAASTADAVPVSEPLAALTTSKILFMSWNAMERADVLTIDPQGTNKVNLTNTAGSEYAPAWSYDHKRVAFVRPRLDANKVWHNDIYIMNADGTNKHWARSSTYTSDLNHPAWSPDGTHLMVTATIQGYGILARLELSTGNIAVVAPNGMLGVNALQGEYDPTGKSILYLSSLTHTIRQFVPGGDEKVLLTADRTIQNATFSPDGKKIAYSKYVSSTNVEVFVLTLATGISKRLTFNAGDDARPTWSPDGARLAFCSKRSGSYQIWTMNASTGGNLIKVTNVLDAANPAWWH
jgi:TolB protein